MRRGNLDSAIMQHKLFILPNDAPNMVPPSPTL
jgi:hypothetical protein